MHGSVSQIAPVGAKERGRAVGCDWHPVINPGSECQSETGAPRQHKSHPTLAQHSFEHRSSNGRSFRKSDLNKVGDHFSLISFLAHLFVQRLISFIPLASLLPSHPPPLIVLLVTPPPFSIPLHLLLISFSFCLSSSVIVSQVLHRSKFKSQLSWPESRPCYYNQAGVHSMPPLSPQSFVFIPHSVPPSSCTKPPQKNWGKIWETHQGSTKPPKRRVTLLQNRTQ